jgi:hypothetical protein
MARSEAIQTHPPPDIYIRGAQAREPRHARHIALTAYGVVLTGLVVILATQVAHERSQANRLHTHGQQTTATVTGCRALASGTGITASGYRCNATYLVGNQRLTAPIHETTALYPIGQRIPIVVDPQHPNDIAAATTAQAASRMWTSLALPAAPLTLLILSAAWLLAHKRRNTRRRRVSDQPR